MKRLSLVVFAGLLWGSLCFGQATVPANLVAVDHSRMTNEAWTGSVYTNSGPLSRVSNSVQQAFDWIDDNWEHTLGEVLVDGYSTSFNYGMSNAFTSTNTLFDVLNWIDNRWYMTIDDWTWLAPTGQSPQAVFNWIDDNSDGYAMLLGRGTNAFDGLTVVPAYVFPTSTVASNATIRQAIHALDDAIEAHTNLDWMPGTNIFGFTLNTNTQAWFANAPRVKLVQTGTATRVLSHNNATNLFIYPAGSLDPTEYDDPANVFATSSVGYSAVMARTDAMVLAVAHFQFIPAATNAYLLTTIGASGSVVSVSGGYTAGIQIGVTTNPASTNAARDRYGLNTHMLVDQDGSENENDGGSDWFSTASVFPVSENDWIGLYSFHGNFSNVTNGTYTDTMAGAYMEVFYLGTR